MHRLLLVLVAAAVSAAGALATAPPNGKRLLVAGGSGYLGRQVCREALQRGWAVTSLSRRGENPQPGTLLDDVEWVAGSAGDAALLEKLAQRADGFVHAIGLLLDSDSGLAKLNWVTSGSRSVPAEGATYDSEMRLTALALLEAAQRTSEADAAPRPFVYVSAAEAGWAENEFGTQLLEGGVVPGWLGRYLDTKRQTEAALTAGGAAAGVRVLLARPSFMWDETKLDILPFIPVWSAAAALNVGDGAFATPLRVEAVGAALVAAAEDAALSGLVPSSQLQSLTPLAVTQRPKPLDTLTSGLASIARLPYGTTVAEELQAASNPAAPPAAELRLYEFEGCPFCRRVREMITYLDLSVTVLPCGRGSRHRAVVEAAAAAQGKKRAAYPYLEDDAAGVKLFESEDISRHLLERYGGGAPLPPPADYFFPSALVTGWAPILLRPTRGGKVHPAAAAAAPAQPLTLYSYDGNQFCRLVREAMVELDLPYTLVSIGKGSPRRAELVERKGRSTAPYLEDANTGAALFESADICEYLWRTYATQ